MLMYRHSYKIFLSFLIFLFLFFVSPIISHAAVFAPSSCGELSSTDLATEMANQVDSRISGLTDPTGLMSLFTTRGSDSVSWVKNSNLWTNRGSSVLDFSGQSVWNTTGGYMMSGTLISPRHIIFADHYQIVVGDTVTFIASDGSIVNRTLQSKTTITDGSNTTDITVGLLDSDVPNTVAYYPILTGTQYDNYLSPISNVPSLWLDQYDKVATGNMSILNEPICTTALNNVCSDSSQWTGYNVESSSGNTRHLFWKNVITGDSGNPVFLAVDGQLVLLTVHTTAGTGNDYSRYITQINTTMASLQGGGSPYQVSTYDLSCFSQIDISPAISNAHFSINDASVNGTIVGTTTATPYGSYPIIYSITSGNTGNAFSIDSSTGIIIVATSSTLSFTAIPSYTLTVQAASDDGSGLSGSNRYTTATVVVDILPAPLAASSSVAYFYSESDTAWGTVGNWYTDYNHTTILGRIPNATDVVIITGLVSPVVTTNLWVSPTYINAQLDGGVTFSGSGTVSPTLVGDVVFIGTVTFSGTITGNVTFNTGTRNSGNITGNVIFSGESYNDASVHGDVTYNDTSCMGEISHDIITYGNVVFNYVTETTTLTLLSSGNESCFWGSVTGTVKNNGGQIITDYFFGSLNYNYGTVNGDASFSSYTRNKGTITGNAVYRNVTGTNTITLTSGSWYATVNGTTKGNDGTTITSWIFNGSSVNLGTINGSVTFNTSDNYNSGTVNGTIIFNAGARNYGNVLGSVTFNGASCTGERGDNGITFSSNITANAVFNDTSSNVGYPITGNVTFNGVNTYSSGPIIGNVVFSSATNGILTLSKPYGAISGTVKGGDGIDINSWVFNTGSYNLSTVGASTFNGTSNNRGTTTATTTFNDSSYNMGNVIGSAIFNGDLSQNFLTAGQTTYRGTINGTKTRHYSTTTNASTRDFITDGPWTIQADNAAVTMTDQTKYNTATVFIILNGGSFPGLVITPPNTTAVGYSDGAIINLNEVFHDSALITLSCNDGNGPGCYSTFYCVDSTNTCTPTTSYTNSIRITIPAGLYTRYLKYYSVDYSSNAESIASFAISINQPSAGSSSYIPEPTTPSEPTIPTQEVIPPVIPPTTQETLIAQLQSQIAILQAQIALIISTRNNNVVLGSIPLGFIFSKQLNFGMVDNDVKYLQIILNADKDTQVSISGVGSSGHEITRFGLATFNAVKKFQQKYAPEILTPQGFKNPTGIVGPSTIKKLNIISSALR